MRLPRDGRVIGRAGEIAESYRQAELRLRRLLLGDGMLEPGVVKGEEARMRVLSTLRRMREAFDAALGEDVRRAETSGSPAVELQAELLGRAAQAAGPDPARDLLTPAEVAAQLGVNLAAVYRAVKRNEIAALRRGKSRRAALAIPASEVRRLRDAPR